MKENTQQLLEKIDYLSFKQINDKIIKKRYKRGIVLFFISYLLLNIYGLNSHDFRESSGSIQFLLGLFFLIGMTFPSLGLTVLLESTINYIFKKTMKFKTINNEADNLENSLNTHLTNRKTQHEILNHFSYLKNHGSENVDKLQTYFINNDTTNIIETIDKLLNEEDLYMEFKNKNAKEKEFIEEHNNYVNNLKEEEQEMNAGLKNYL